MPNKTCPERDVFLEFLTGKLEDEQLQTLEAHLAECDACGDTIRSMNVDDTFIDLVRVNDQDAFANPGDDTQLSELMQKLESLADPRSSADPLAMGSSSNEDSQSKVAQAADLASRVHEVQTLLSPSESDDEIGRLAHYRILKLLGAGGMGVVYQAEDTQLQRHVALKILRPSLGRAARERFIQEARAAAAIEHDNVVTIYNVGSEGPLAYLAMQFLDGETLESRLKRDGRLSADEVIHIVSQVADGLAAAHAKKLIHRDIKPANVLISADRKRATLLDFGLAYAVDDNPELTETGMIAGTPAYMSPEQAQGQPVDERSDLFSLGTMMYRMLTGEMPFAGTNALATIRSIQNDDPTPPRQIDMNTPATLSDTVMDLLEKDARSRPEDTQSVADALRNRTQPPVRHKPEAKTQSQPSKGNGGRVLATALACGGLIAAAMVYHIQTDKGQITVKTDDPNIQVEVLQGGNVVNIIDPSTNDTVTVKSGSYQLALKNPTSEVRLAPGEVTVTRDGKETVSVSTSRPVEPLEANEIGVGSFVKIECAEDSKLNVVRQVEHSGQVAVMPGIRVSIEGMTYKEAEAAIDECLKAVFTEPRILVSVPDEYRMPTQVPETVEPGALIWFSCLSAGIEKDLRVEPNGELALGAGLPRVAVAGLTFEQAEQRVNRELKSVLREPMALLTLSVNAVPSEKVGHVSFSDERKSESMVSSSQDKSPVDSKRDDRLAGKSAEEVLLELQAMRSGGDASKAVPVIHAILETHPTTAFRIELARCYAAIGESELALGEYDRVIKYGGQPTVDENGRVSTYWNQPEWLFERGKIYESISMTKEAFNDYAQAFALDPTNKEVAAARARLRASMEQQAAETEKKKNTIQPGDQIHVAVSGLLPQAPINGLYLVEPAGTVPLGPQYGRANVANMTVEQAEAEITKVLQEIAQHPQVMVTAYTDVRQTSLLLKHATADAAAGLYHKMHPNSRVRIQPDTRTNSLLVVTTSEADYQQLTRFIEQIDRPVSKGAAGLGNSEDGVSHNGQGESSLRSAPFSELAANNVANELANLRAARDKAKQVDEIKQRMTSRLSIATPPIAGERHAEEPMFRGKTFSHWLSIARNERDTPNLHNALNALKILTENDVHRSKRTCEALDVVVSRQRRQNKSVISSVAEAYLSCDANVAMTHLIEQLETRNGQLVLSSISSNVQSSPHLLRSKAMQEEIAENDAMIFETLTTPKGKSFDSNPKIVSQLASKLDLNDEQVDEILPVLVQSLKSRDLTTVVDAANALARYKPDTVGLIEPLIRIIGNQKLYTTHHCVYGAFEALAKLGPRAKDSVPTIVEALPILTGGESTKQFVERWAMPDLAKLAVEALIQIGSDAKESLPMLRELIERLEADAEMAKERKGFGGFHPSTTTGRDGTKMTEVMELAKKAIVVIGGQPAETTNTESNEPSAQTTPANQ